MKGRRSSRLGPRGGTRRTGAVTLSLFVGTALAALWLAHVTHLGTSSTLVAILVGGGTPAGLYLAWATYRDAHGNYDKISLARASDDLAVTVQEQREYRDGGGRRLLELAEQKIKDQLKAVEPGQSDTKIPHIILRFQRQPAAVTRGNRPIDRGRDARNKYKDKTGLRQVLADSHELLVLGDTGSGKTTALFELAKDLIAESKEDNDQSIPVVLNLSTWGKQQASAEGAQDDERDATMGSAKSKVSAFEDWMVSALNIQYGIAPKFGRYWVHNDRLLPLFDGLDEVIERRRDMCVQAINGFATNHSCDIVVSCRTKEYENIPTRLSLQEAVVIKPPTMEEARDYLKDCGVQGVLPDSAGDGALQSLLSAPLMLDVIANVYAGQPEQSGDLVSMPGTLEQALTRILSAYEARMLERRPVPRYFWSDGALDGPPLKIKENWEFQTVLWLVWLARLMHQQTQNEFHLDRIQPDCLQSRAQRHLVVVLPAVGMGLVTSIIMTSLIAFSWPFTVAGPWGLLGGILIGFDGLGWRTLSRRDDRPVIDPVEEVSWKWSRRRLAAGAGIGAAAGLAAGLIARLLGELRGVFHPQGVWNSSLLVLQQLGEWPVWPAICIAAIGACAVMSGLGGGLGKGQTVPNEGILRSARRAFSIGIPAGLLGGFFAGVVIRPIASIYTTVMMSFFFAFAVGLAFGGRACLRHMTLRLLLVYNDFAPLNFNAFLQDSADRLFLRRSAGGYTFHQVIRDYFGKHYDPDDPPHARSAVRMLKALVRLSP
jgi:hypothetical protein